MSFPTQFNLGLVDGKKYIEFGGGDHPRVRAGIDVRVDARPVMMPDGSAAVDIVVNMDNPFTAEFNQALSSGEFDGAVSIFALEHVSWRKVPQFLSEVRRVLKDDGMIFFVVPNTEAQMKHLLETQDWDDAGSMLFGDQDYPDNTHKAAFSPSSIDKLLKVAGFKDIVVQPFGAKGTDMVVSAHCAPLYGVPPGPAVIVNNGSRYGLAPNDRLLQGESTHPPLLLPETFKPLSKPAVVVTGGPTEEEARRMIEELAAMPHQPVIAERPGMRYARAVGSAVLEADSAEELERLTHIELKRQEEQRNADLTQKAAGDIPRQVMGGGYPGAVVYSGAIQPHLGALSSMAGRIKGQADGWTADEMQRGEHLSEQEARHLHEQWEKTHTGPETPGGGIIAMETPPTSPTMDEWRKAWEEINDGRPMPYEVERFLQKPRAGKIVLPPDSPDRTNVWVGRKMVPAGPPEKHEYRRMSYADLPQYKGLWLGEPSTLQLERAGLFGRQYFDGGLPAGGGYQMYWDSPCHELTSRHVLERRPTSVLELGCGRGYVVKRLEDARIPVAGWDISRHCYLSRVSDSAHLYDATDPKRWDELVDHSVDLCFSIAFLDHVPEELLPAVIRGMAGACKRGLHGVNFDGGGGDSTRATRKPKEWWQSVLPPGHEVVDKAELEAGTLPEWFYRGDGKVKLNLGSYATMFHHGWTNVDVHDLRAFAEQNRYNYKIWDVRNGLPWGSESVDLIYQAHMLEHLTYDEGAEYLRECRRVLRPGGAMRAIVPDAGQLIIDYFHDNRAADNPGKTYLGPGLSQYVELSGTVERAKTPAMKLQAVLCDNHKALYDAETLGSMLEDAGFHAVQGAFRTVRGNPGGECREGFAQIQRETLDVLPSVSLYFDAVPARL